MPTWIVATVAFGAGWMVCTLYQAIVRWLDRLFDVPPAQPMSRVCGGRCGRTVDVCEDIYPIDEWEVRRA